MLKTYTFRAAESCDFDHSFKMSSSWTKKYPFRRVCRAFIVRSGQPFPRDRRSGALQRLQNAFQCMFQVSRADWVLGFGWGFMVETSR
jgi:hypothetical protein